MLVDHLTIIVFSLLALVSVFDAAFNLLVGDYLSNVVAVTWIGVFIWAVVTVTHYLELGPINSTGETLDWFRVLAGVLLLCSTVFTMIYLRRKNKLMDKASRGLQNESHNT